MFSLVIPVYNEEKLIDELLNRTVAAIELFTADYEIIIVDDGSTDRSLERILNHHHSNKRIKPLSLSRNFGHQAAYTAGLEHTEGEVVGMMDGDLQDPPELLAEMYRKLKTEAYDIVNGLRTGRKGNNSRNFYTWLFHRIFKSAGEDTRNSDFGNFSIMSRDALNALLSMKEKVRYLPGLRAFIGFRQGAVEYVRDERFSGKPKMSFKKLLMLASDAIFSFSRFPIRLCLILGITGTLIFMAAGIYVLFAKITGIAVTGWSSTLLSIYFLGSIQLVFLGILGEYTFRSYRESQNRPIYFIKKFYDGKEES